VGGRTIVSFPNNHLQYALTWFALALGLLAVFFAWARQQVKGRGDAPPSPAPRT
jgi:surfeit locus 1 family protein